MDASLIAAWALAGVLLAVTAGMWVLSMLGLLSGVQEPSRRPCGHAALVPSLHIDDCWQCRWAKAKGVWEFATHHVLPHH